MDNKPGITSFRGQFRRVFLLLAVLLSMLGSSALAQQQNGISVSGSGTVYGTPDRAVFQAGVNVAETDVSAATAEANTITQQILDALTAAGIDSRDVRTSNFTVRREDRWSQDNQPLAPLYRVTNTVNVTVRDAGKVGDLLGLVLANGANQVNSVNFTHSDPAALEKQARELAMADAHDRASQLAELAGVTLGTPTSISENAEGGPPMPLANARVAYAMAESSVPVAVGELGVTVNVYVNYAIAGSSPAQ